MKTFLALRLSDVVCIMLINVIMPTIVGILTFMSKINFVLSWVEHGKSFITSGPGFLATYVYAHAILCFLYAHAILCFLYAHAICTCYSVFSMVT